MKLFFATICLLAILAIKGIHTQELYCYVCDDCDDVSVLTDQAKQICNEDSMIDTTTVVVTTTLATTTTRTTTTRPTTTTTTPTTTTTTTTPIPTTTIAITAAPPVVTTVAPPPPPPPPPTEEPAPTNPPENHISAEIPEVPELPETPIVVDKIDEHLTILPPVFNDDYDDHADELIEEQNDFINDDDDDDDDDTDNTNDLIIRGIPADSKSEIITNKNQRTIPKIFRLNGSSRQQNSFACFAFKREVDGEMITKRGCVRRMTTDAESCALANADGDTNIQDCKVCDMDTCNNGTNVKISLILLCIPLLIKLLFH